MSISKSQLVSLCLEFNTAVEGKVNQDAALIQKFQAAPLDVADVTALQQQVMDFQAYISQSPELMSALQAGKTPVQIAEEDLEFADKYLSLLDTTIRLTYDVVVAHDSNLFASSVPEAGKNEETAAALEEAGAPNMAKAFRLSLG